MKKLRPDFKKYYTLYKQKYGKLFTDQDKKRTTAYTYLILTLFTVSFFGFFAIKPTLSTISTLQKEKSDSQQVLEELNKKLAALQTLSAQYEQMGAPTINLINAAVPPSPQIPELTRKIEVIAHENNLDVRRLDFGSIEIFPQTKSDSPIFSFIFTISAEGNTSDVNHFISKLINIDRIITLEQVTTNNIEGLQDASITGRAYFYKQ